MEAKLTRLAHKIAPFSVFAPGGQSGNFWIHPRTLLFQISNQSHYTVRSYCHCFFL